MPRDIPVELMDRAVADYETTRSCVKSAKKFGIGVTTLHRELLSRGVTCDGLDVFRNKLRKLPDIDVLRPQYEAGDTPAVIGARYGVSPFTVIAALRAAGIPRRRRGNTTIVLDEKMKARLFELYDAGYNHAQIAGILNLAPITVSRLLRANGFFVERRARREKHGQWRGGRTKTAQGYVRVLVEPDDVNSSMRDVLGYVLEHRLVVARSLGRPLHKHETVHHINGDRSDNRLENLQLRKGKHGAGVVMKCAACGSHDIVCAELN